MYNLYKAMNRKKKYNCLGCVVTPDIHSEERLSSSDAGLYLGHYIADSESLHVYSRRLMQAFYHEVECQQLIEFSSKLGSLFKWAESIDSSTHSQYTTRW